MALNRDKIPNGNADDNRFENHYGIFKLQSERIFVFFVLNK